MEYRTIEIKSKQQFKRFITLPCKIYKDLPLWVPPLFVEVKDKLNPDKNPFFEYGKVKLFGVINNRHILVARGAAILNPLHNNKYKDMMGFFGLFECIHDKDAARCLFTSIKNQLKSWQCKKITGPVNFTTNEESGFLIHGFNKSPAFMTNYCPPYYQELMRACGFEKAVDMFSYEWNLNHSFPGKFNRIITRVSVKSKLHLRPFSRKQMKDELAKIREIYNASFTDVWGFVPITQRETEEMGKAFELFADDDLILFAEHNKKTIGFCLALPDLNEILRTLHGRLFPFGIVRLLFRRKKINKARVMVICVDPRYRFSGAVALMIHRLHTTGISKGYRKAELSVIIETNTRMRDVLDALGFKAIKTFRLFQSPITHSGEQVT